MIRQDQPGGVHLTSTLFRKKTTASIPKSVTRLFNKAILHDVFNIDNGDDSEDLMIIDDKVSKSNNGNTIETIHQVAKISDDTYHLDVEKFGQITATESSNGCPLAISHNVFDIDNDDDSEDLVILDEEVGKSNKGKEIEAIHQVVEVSDNNLSQSGMHNFCTVRATETSNNYPLVSNDIIDIDYHGSDLSYGDGYDKDLVIIGEEVSKSNKGKQIEAPHQVVPSIEYFGPTSGIESSNGSPLVYLSYDDGDDSDDLMIIGEEVNKSNKGKTIETIHQEVSDYTLCQPAVNFFGSVAQGVIDIDDDDSDDLMIIGEDVSKSNKGKTIEIIPEVVAHLDNIDVPSRIEVPFTFFRESDNVLRRSTFESSTCNDTQSAATNINSRQPPTSTNFESATKATSFCNSYSMNQAHLDNINMPSRTEAPFTSSRDSGIGLRMDNMDVPSRIEVPFTFFRESDKVLRRSTFESSTCNDTQSATSNIKPRQPPTSTNFESATKTASACNSSSMNQAHLDNVNIPSKTEAPLTSSRDSGIGLRMDNMDVPSRIEVPFTFFRESDNVLRRSTFESSTCNDTQSAATNINSRQSPTFTNFESATKATSLCNSYSMNQEHLDNINMPSRTEAPFTSSRDSGIGLRRSTFESSTFESSTLYDTQSAATNINTTYKPPASTNFERATKASSVYNSSSMNQAPFTSFRDSGIGLRSTFESSTLYGTQSEATNSYLKASSQGSTMGSSSLQNKVDNIYDSMGIQFSSSIFYQATPNKRKSTAPPTSANSKSAKKARLNNVDTDYDDGYDYNDEYDYDDTYDSDEYDYDDRYNSTSTYQYTPNKRKSSAPTTSTNFRSAKKAHLDNFCISYENGASFTLFSESNLGTKKSRHESSSTQSKARNSKASYRSSRLLEPANSKIQGSTMRSSNLQIKMDNKKSAAQKSVSCAKKAASSMRLLDAPKPLAANKIISGKKAGGIDSKNSHATSSSKPSQLLALGAPMRLITASKPSAATNTVSGKKAAGSGSKKSQATSSSNPSLPLLDSSAHMSGSLFSKSVSSKKKADAPMRLLPAPKPPASNKIVSGKKAAGSNSKKSQATSSSNPSLPLLDSSAHMSSSLISKSVSSKKKADAPMRLLPAPKPSAANKIISGKKAAGSGSKKSQATSSSKPSQSLNSGALMGSSLFSQSVSFKKPSRSFNSDVTSMKKQAAPMKQAAPSGLLLEYQMNT